MPIADPTFLPALRQITAITQANPAAVATSFAHDYTTGLIVRLKIAPGYGMIQAQNLFGEITVTGANTFTIAVDTSSFDPFVVPGLPFSRNFSQVIPIAENSAMLAEATRNVLT